MKPFLLLLSFLAFAFASKTNYEGYSIYRCPTEGEWSKQFRKAMKMNMKMNIQSFRFEELSHGPGSVDLLVEPSSRKNFLFAFDCKVVVENVQLLIDQEEEEIKATLARFSSFNETVLDSDSDPYHQSFHRYSEIIAKVKEIAGQYPSLVTYSVAGKTIEGRDIPLVRIKGTGGGSNKKTIFINGGIHAREWVSPATLVYIIQSLAGKYGKDSLVTSLLDSIEFYLIPSSNPDGYEYSWTNDRMWRKNRNNNNGNSCKGVDLNRNFDVVWGTGSSSNRCAQDYHGTSPASEPEVQTIQSVVSSMPNKIGAIDIHSYGQYIMRPFGWTYQLHPDEVILKQLGGEIVDTIKKTNGATYSNIRSAELYPVSGASDDWFTVKQNLWGFCFELRDTGRYGFQLPANQILPTAQEIFAGILTYSSFVLQNFKA